MGTFLPTLVSSPSTEKAFLTEVYNYMMSLYTGITCDVIDSDGVTILGHDVDSFVWVSGSTCNMDFNLGGQYKLRFQTSPVSASSHLRSSGYNVSFMHDTSTIMAKGSGSTRYSTSGCVSFGKQDSNGDVVSFEYPNNPRRILFTTYTSDSVFILWITPYTGDSFTSADSISLMKFMDTNNNWHWTSYASPNVIESGSVYDADGLNPSTKNSIFSYEAGIGYLDYLSQSNFVVGDTKVFQANNIFDCSAVNIGDTFLLDDNHSYMAIGTHSLVPLDYDIPPSLIDKTITENGTYSAKDDGADGYSEVTVNVISYKNYIKFNGEGIMLPWSINSDYKIEVTFHETTYYNDSAIIGNSIGPSDMHLTEYNNKYYFLQSRNGETNYGTWSAGEHTFIYNNGEGKNTLDGTVVSNFTPYNYSSALYSIGCRGGITSNVYNGWIKSYKIYSISQDELIHDLRPAIVAGYPCFIDVIGNAIYSNSSIQAVDTIT